MGRWTFKRAVPTFATSTTRATSAHPALALVRGNEGFQVSPRNNLLHLFVKGFLAGFLGQKIEVQRGFLMLLIL